MKYNHLRKYLVLSHHAKIGITNGPATLLLNIYLNIYLSTLICVHNETKDENADTSLFIIAKNSKQLKCPSAEEELTKKILIQWSTTQLLK